MRRLAATISVLAAGMTLAACGSSGHGGGSGDGGSERVTLGALLPYTGDLSAIAPPIDGAIKLAARAASDAGGGKLAVTVKAGDSQGDPQQAIQAARQLLDGGASCIVGPATTPEVQSVLTSVTKLPRVPLLPFAGGNAVTTLADDGTVFRTVPPNRLQSAALVTAVERALGGAQGKTVSFAYQNGPYGEDFVGAFTSAWTKAGGKIQGPVGYDPNQTSYDAEAAKIVAGHPDAYVIVDYPDTYAKVGAALLRTGRFDARKLFVPTTLALPQIPAGVPAAALEGARGVRVGSPSDTPQARAFDQLVAASGGRRGALDANAFDAGILCALAAVKAGSDAPGKIADALPAVAGPPGLKVTFLQLRQAFAALRAGKEVDYEGVSGPIDFDANGDPATQLFDFWRYQHGTLVVDRQAAVG